MTDATSYKNSNSPNCFTLSHPKIKNSKKKIDKEGGQGVSFFSNRPKKVVNLVVDVVESRIISPRADEGEEYCWWKRDKA